MSYNQLKPEIKEWYDEFENDLDIEWEKKIEYFDQTLTYNEKTKFAARATEAFWEFVEEQFHNSDHENYTPGSLKVEDLNWEGQTEPLKKRCITHNFEKSGCSPISGEFWYNCKHCGIAKEKA